MHKTKTNLRRQGFYVKEKKKHQSTDVESINTNP